MIARFASFMSGIDDTILHLVFELNEATHSGAHHLREPLSIFKCTTN
jgi:hypothetical protein